MGGFVMSPFGDWLSDITGVVGKVADAVGDVAGAFRPPNAQPYPTGQSYPAGQPYYQQQQQQQRAPDNTLLYVGGGAALLFAAFMLTRR